MVKELLPEYDGSLAKAALWGDQIKSNHSYDWAKSLHYVNPVNDDPPMVCAYHIGQEDCPGDICVVSAIRNYTTLLTNPQADRNEALKFLIHFIGDLHQPLHATGRARGGTQTQVKFGGRLTNLHSIWDSMMFQKRINEDFKRSQTMYSEYIVKSIGTTWRGEINEWLSCSNKTLPLLKISNNKKFDNFGLDQLVCPELWAAFSNRVNCKSVWPGYKRKFELSGKYYQDNIKVEEKMLAQAAVRISAILNAIAEK